MTANDFDVNTYNRYPRDVTAPGPYQRRGVAEAQKVGSQETPKESAPPKSGDKPAQTPPQTGS